MLPETIRACKVFLIGTTGLTTGKNLQSISAERAYDWLVRSCKTLRGTEPEQFLAPKVEQLLTLNLMRQRTSWLPAKTAQPADKIVASNFAFMLNRLALPLLFVCTLHSCLRPISNASTKLRYRAVGNSPQVIALYEAWFGHPKHILSATLRRILTRLGTKSSQRKRWELLRSWSTGTATENPSSTAPMLKCKRPLRGIDSKWR